MTQATYLPDLNAAAQLAGRGLFDDFQSTVEQCGSRYANDLAAQLDLGSLCQTFGFLALARGCFMRARSLAPNDFRALANIANLERDAGNHGIAAQIYAELLRALPDHPVIRRNALIGMEYDPSVSDAQRLQAARQWGQWLVDRTGGPRPRPPVTPLGNRPLHIAYLGADFCQHTVGLLIHPVLTAHDRSQVKISVFSAGHVNDWLTADIQAVTHFHQVAQQDDATLAQAIRNEQVDVLVDLSGHTAGSRLSVFAHRPAPVMVSWLGYFATTGLSFMDAVLLDDVHAPSGMESQFAEPLLRLPSGRFCYTPVSWAPGFLTPAACERNGFVTFGSFNNTAKYNPAVFDCWARILQGVSNSRLVLKWRTFNDHDYRQQILHEFASRGIDPTRVELRGPSFHAHVLQEYADIDIALDPFPFTGGLTSCEALWMGVPVITWPQSRVVSRQTLSILSAIGLADLAAEDADDYVHKAVTLAGDSSRLAAMRSGLRARMSSSPLMDVSAFTRSLESALRQTYSRIATSP